MSSGPDFEVKEQIRQNVDIVDLVNGYITLRRTGRGYVGLCPWHEDSRPSLQVNPDRQSWKCWVCDIGGDIFSFMMQREGVDFREAIAMLADRAGIELQPNRRQAPITPGSPEDKRTLYQAVAWAEQQFHQCLLHADEAESARIYLEDRGINSQSVERFHIGYAPDNYQWLIERAHATSYSPQVLEAVGLVGKGESGRYYDRFRGRVMFSIRDTQRRPIAFGGRVLPQIAQQQSESNRPPAKYINSPETRLFSKSDQLYGLDLVRDSVSKSRHVVVVEGYTDAVMANQAGLENVVAVLGTALGQRHLRLLRRFADTVTLVLDGDEAGQRRTNEILELFVAEQLDLRILTLPEGLDPCDYLQQHGAEAFQQLLDQAVDALEHKIRIVTKDLDPITQTHRANQAIEELLSTLAKAPRLQSGTTISNRLREQQILSRLAREFRIGEGDLRARLNELRRKSHSRPTGSKVSEESDGKESIADFLPEEVGLIEILALRADLAPTALEQVSPDWFSPGPLRKIFLTYHQLHQAGHSLDFKRVLSELEDPKLKNLLVHIDEDAAGKSDHASIEDYEFLQDMIQIFLRRREHSDSRRLTAELETGKLNEDDAMKKLLELHQRENQRHTKLIDQSGMSNELKDRQGISAPTDG